MKHASVHSRSLRQDTSLSQHRPVTGSNGISIAPPKYGIDFVDRQQTAVSGNQALDATIQRRAREDSSISERRQKNGTVPHDHLKAGIETLSGMAEAGLMGAGVVQVKGGMQDARSYLRSVAPLLRNPVAARARKLPKELEYKTKPQDRARTWEETKIDVAGTGSALKSLVTSPWKTLKNVAKGMVSGFPSRATIRKQAVVQNAIGAAWAAAQGDYRERFGWITWDKTADTYAVPAVSVGDQYQCTPPPKPADPAPGAANQVFHVGEFHIHPPLDPGEPAMANPRDWPIGPSEQDETAAQADHSPGIVRDFDKIDRNGGVTDYTYGPWTRTE